MKMGEGTEKRFYSGHWVPHPISERLEEVVRTWIWYTGTDQIHNDSEVRFRCGECKFALHAETQRAKIGHLVTMHGYNMNGYVRKNASS